MRRRFGSQPGGISQVQRKKKVHELVDDREGDPYDRDVALDEENQRDSRGMVNGKPGWSKNTRLPE